jgi:hypothetical protein
MTVTTSDQALIFSCISHHQSALARSAAAKICIPLQASAPSSVAAEPNQPNRAAPARARALAPRTAAARQLLPQPRAAVEGSVPGRWTIARVDRRKRRRRQ